MVANFFGEADALVAKMRTALQNGNGVEMGKAAHRLKGTACYLGAPAAMEATQGVERAGKNDDLSGAAEAIERLAQQVATLKEALAPHWPVKP